MKEEDQNSSTWFRDQGFFLKRKLFSREEMAEAKEIAMEHYRGDDSGVHVWMVENLPKEAKKVVTHPSLVECMKSLVGPKVEFLSVKPVFKSGEVRFGTPWHQDWPYWRGSVSKVSIWIALDDASRSNGCLKVIPGSHHQDFLHEKSKGKFGNRVSEELIDESQAMDVELKAGDALFFSDRLLHASHSNTSGEERWSFIPTYRDASLTDELDSEGGLIWEKSILL